MDFTAVIPQDLRATASPTFAGLSVGNLTLDSASITDLSGAIAFGDENLSTAGTITAGNLTIGSASITDTSGAIAFGNENLSTTGTITAGNLTIASASITDTSGSISFGNENLSTTGTVAGGVPTFDISGEIGSGGFQLNLASSRYFNIYNAGAGGSAYIYTTGQYFVESGLGIFNFYNPTSGKYFSVDHDNYVLYPSATNEWDIGTASLRIKTGYFIGVNTNTFVCAQGWNGSFTNGDGDTVGVSNGLIVSVT